MSYIGKSPTGTGIRSRYYYTATGGETSISGADDSGATLTFTDGAYVDVYLNGVLLVAGTDYNTSTANTIGGLAALAGSDIVEVLVYDTFTVADAVKASSGGTFNGSVTVNGTVTANGLGVGITSPAYDAHIHESDSGNSLLHFTNATTGTTGSDGFTVGLDASEQAILLHRENTSMVQYTNGTQRLRLENNGDISFYESTGVTQGLFWDASTRRLGLGETSPSRELHVKNFGTNIVSDYQIVIEGNSAGYGAGVSFQSQITGGSLAEMARITADGENSWNTTASTQDAGLRFFTSLDGTVSERMRIDSVGNVLVGNSTTPSAASANAPALLVSGPNDATIQLSRENATAGGGAIQSAAGAGLVFYTHTGAVGSESYSERMRIDSSGAVDISGILSAAATESKSTDGYVKLPSGIYLQWKTAGANTSGVTTAWPITFPNAVWGAWAINNNQTNPPAPSVTITTSNFTLTVSAGGPQCYVLGIGY
jgi:hypothetical protein